MGTRDTIPGGRGNDTITTTDNINRGTDVVVADSAATDTVASNCES